MSRGMPDGALQRALRPYPEWDRADGCDACPDEGAIDVDGLWLCPTCADLARNQWGTER